MAYFSFRLWLRGSSSLLLCGPYSLLDGFILFEFESCKVKKFESVWELPFEIGVFYCIHTLEFFDLFVNFKFVILDLIWNPEASYL